MLNNERRQKLDQGDYIIFSKLSNCEKIKARVDGLLHLVLYYFQEQLFIIFFFARNLEILSFGEKLSGRVITNNELEWQNPYGKNRWLIFLMYIFTFLVIRDSRILSGYMFSLSQLILYFIEIFIMYYSLGKISKGKLIGGYILATIYFIKSVF